ncbi:hypothetical protein K1719_044924 [Acacia pycnantha]|nr:hypothetical protein K1719_044924 [Acacia pycnantha]
MMATKSFLSTSQGTGGFSIYGSRFEDESFACSYYIGDDLVGKAVIVSWVIEDETGSSVVRYWSEKSKEKKVAMRRARKRRWLRENIPRIDTSITRLVSNNDQSFKFKPTTKRHLTEHSQYNLPFIIPKPRNQNY